MRDGSDFKKRLWPPGNADDRTIIQHQPVAVAQRDCLPQVEHKLGAAFGGQNNAAAITLVRIERDAPPTRTSALEAAARAVLLILTDTRPEWQEAIAAWHRRKTAIYAELISSGAVPARPGIARVVAEALAAGWTVAVASTSAEPSVRATLEHAVGAENARSVSVFAGDVVAAKKPDPAIYTLALARLGTTPAETSTRWA